MADVKTGDELLVFNTPEDEEDDDERRRCLLSENK